MGMWTAIALISIAGIIGGAYRHRQEKGINQEAADQIETLKRRVDALDRDLRERVEVLERIVTDRKEDLRRQFDHLDKAS